MNSSAIVAASFCYFCTKTIRRKREEPRIHRPQARETAARWVSEASNARSNAQAMRIALLPLLLSCTDALLRLVSNFASYSFILGI